MYDGKWQRARGAHLAAHPLCVDCMARGLVVEATVVDHDVPHGGDRERFWDRSNWRSRCKTCHDTKTATQDGGFGNPRASRGGAG